MCVWCHLALESLPSERALRPLVYALDWLECHELYMCAIVCDFELSRARAKENTCRRYLARITNERETMESKRFDGGGGGGGDGVDCCCNRRCRRRCRRVCR